MAQTFDSILKYPMATDKDIRSSLENTIKIVSNNISDYTYKFPANSTIENIYPKTDNDDWTNGFWTGCIWLAYELTEDEKFRKAAEIQVDSFLERIEKRIVVNNHDMGFLYSLSCVAAYKLTKNENAKKAAIMAADNLVARYRDKGEFIQAWGDVDNPSEYRLIIDCLLNLPILYWASEVTGNEDYRLKAQKHIKTAMECVLREDNSTYHTYFFDVNTGKPLKGVTKQGYSNDSAWSRGQAWGIYGTALSYKYLKNEEYIEKFEKVTDYFIKHLPDDLIPYWDFIFDTGSNEVRDSSASAIAICGMLEMSKYLPEDKAKKYTDTAKRMLKALMDYCENKEYPVCNGILKHGVYAKKSPYNPCEDCGVDECNIWGDYFYMEALVRLSKDWNLYW